MPDFVLRLGGVPFTGWQQIRVVRSIEQTAGQFEIDASNTPERPALFGEIAGGEECTIEIDGRAVLKGYIDNASGRYSDTDSTISCAGRDRVADLIDCAATVDGPFEFNNEKIDTVIGRIVKPFGIPLTVAADAGAAFERVAIQPGETAFSFIERLCRYRAILPVSDGVGGLILTRPGSGKSAGFIERGVNVLSASASIDAHERFNLYVVKGQGAVLGLETPEESAQAEGRASDKEIGRYRPTVILAESEGYDLTLQQRAEWQARFNKARGKRVVYKVPGWYAGKGRLWQPNTLVTVRDPALGISGERLIAGVSLIRSDEEGTTTELDLVMPDAFDLPAEKDKGDVWGDL